MTIADLQEEVRATHEKIRSSPLRWRVTAVASSSGGTRTYFSHAYVNAPDQFTAIATAMAVEFAGHLFLRHDEVTVTAEPALPVT